MRNVNEKKKFLTCGKCDRCVLGALRSVGESSWSVYEYSKPLRVKGKSLKCLRSITILCSHFFDTSSFTFSSGYLRVCLQQPCIRAMRENARQA